MSEPSKDPSEKQVGFLRVFGLSATTAKEAHEKITEILDKPVAEQARLRVAQMPGAISGSGGHDATFHVACVLIHGYALSQAEAMPVMNEYNIRCQPAWSERELLYKLNSADRTTHDKPRGHLVISNTPAQQTSRPAAASGPAPAPARVYSPRKLALDFDCAKLKQMAAKWRDVVNVEWLANRSTHDPCTIYPKTYLDLMYRPGEKVLLFTVFESQGQAFWPTDEVPAVGENGVWYLAQPVNGQALPNPRTGKMSRRSMESVTEFRYLVLECDKAKELPEAERPGYIRDWLGLIVQLPLKIEAIYTSGGWSVHALVRVDCRTHREWEEYVRALMPTLNLLGVAGVDPKALTSVRLTRLPGCMRAGKLQKLLYLQPGATVRRICDLPPVRDVTAGWLAKYSLVIDGHADSTIELRRALWYYEPCNKSCRTARRELEEAQLTRG